MISLYVDDIIYTSSSSTMLQDFRTDMMQTFKMTDLGLVNHFLGLEVKQDEKGMFIRQRSYIEGVLRQMNMSHCKPAVTPMCMN